MWSQSCLLPEIFSQVFIKVPEVPVWKWAEENVYLSGKSAATAGYYDSSKTPWTRRIQEILVDGRDPKTGDRVHQVSVKKSSVAGYSEACMNVVRFRAKYNPCNVIYAIDSADEARSINDIRLGPTLRQLGEDIFTGNDDDVRKFMIELRHMIIWFLGSYSSGKFANKQAQLVIGDEVEEHGGTVGDTSSITNLKSRIKSGEQGVIALLSKPKLKGGPIDVEHRDGNMERYLVPCPHCGFPHELLWENIRYGHCRDLAGDWDKARVLNETFAVCPECKKEIEEKKWKKQMLWSDEADWDATPIEDRSAKNRFPTPGHVSQHMSDLYSLFPDATWGHLALKCIAAKEKGQTERQGFWNHNLGLEFNLSGSKTEEEDVRKCRAAYRRGQIPRKPWALILDSDIGQDYAKWMIWAFSREGEMWLIDWGSELHPDGVLEVIKFNEYACMEDGERYMAIQGMMDAKYRKTEVEKTCYNSNGLLWPSAGAGGVNTRQSIAFNKLPNYAGSWFGRITYNDRDFKSELYIDRIGKRKQPQLHLPEDVDEEVIREMCGEEMDSRGIWTRKRDNHYGDCAKCAIVLYRWLIREDNEES